VRKVADRVCVMLNGKIVEQGSVEEVFRDPQHPYTQRLLAAEPKGRANPVAADAPVVVEAGPVKVWFPIKRGFFRRTVGHVKAVDEVSIRVREGETVGVVGESGSGKTTLGLAILRLISSQGPIVFLGRRLDGLRSREIRPMRKNLQVVFQDPYGSLSPRLSVAEIVEEGLLVQKRGLSYQERREVVAHALADVGLDPATMDRYPHEFSGGQRQRIAIARAMALEPQFVVLDEPTSALDPVGRADVRSIVRRARDGGSTIFLNSHLLTEVERVCDRVAIVDHGRVLASGRIDDLLGEPTIRVRVTDLSSTGLAALGSFGRVATGEDGWLTVSGAAVETVPDVVASIVASGGRVHAVDPGRATLEDLFMRLVGGGGADAVHPPESAQ
jgi:microcin C transport system ATP-binding protein